MTPMPIILELVVFTLKLDLRIKEDDLLKDNPMVFCKNSASDKKRIKEHIKHLKYLIKYYGG